MLRKSIKQAAANSVRPVSFSSLFQHFSNRAHSSHKSPTIVNSLNEIAALTLLRGGDFLSAFDKHQLEAMAMLFLDLHRYGYILGWILGPWLFSFGILVFRSGFLLRILGVLLIAACFGYLADSLTPLLLPNYEDVVGRIASILLTLGEPAIILGF